MSGPYIFGSRYIQFLRDARRAWSRVDHAFATPPVVRGGDHRSGRGPRRAPGKHVATPKLAAGERRQRRPQRVRRAEPLPGAGVAPRPPARRCRRRRVGVATGTSASRTAPPTTRSACASRSPGTPTTDTAAARRAPSRSGPPRSRPGGDVGTGRRPGAASPRATPAHGRAQRGHARRRGHPARGPQRPRARAARAPRSTADRPLCAADRLAADPALLALLDVDEFTDDAAGPVLRSDLRRGVRLPDQHR